MTDRNRRSARTRPAPHDPYDAFARAYDAWQATYPKPFAEAALPFYERAIAHHGSPDRSLADLACGTGTFLAAWNRRHAGWSLTGIDRSSGMLRAARSKLARRHVPATLLRQPLEQLRLSRPVGVAVCVFDSVNHLIRLQDLRRFIRSAAASLLPGGLLLFDLNDARAFRSLFSGSWSVEGPGLFVSVSTSCRASGLRGSARFTLFERRGRSWRRTDLSIEERNWRRSEVVPALRAAGLRLLRIERFDPYPKGEIEAPRTLWISQAPWNVVS